MLDDRFIVSKNFHLSDTCVLGFVNEPLFFSGEIKNLILFPVVYSITVSSCGIMKIDFSKNFIKLIDVSN